MSHSGLGWREQPLYQGTLGAWDLGSSRKHLSSLILYTFNTKIFIYHAFEIKTRLSYMSLAINVARLEKTDSTIATAIRLRRSDRYETIGYLLQV